MTMFRDSALVAPMALALLLAAASAQAQTFVAAPRAAAEKSLPDKPHADLKVYSSRAVGGTWSGSGSDIISADLCVASTTGRFRLRVLSVGGGKMTSPESRERVGYTVKFRDGAGLQQERRVNGDALITFEGSSPEEADCARGANSSIEIDLAEGELIARPAGRYLDQLVLSVEPL